MTEDDVEAWHKSVEAAAKARGETQSAKGSYDTFFHGESSLSVDERILLDQVLAGQSSDWLQSHGAEIATAVGKLTQDEFEKYLFDTPPGLLTSLGTNDMAIFMDVLSALSPTQALYLLARADSPSPLHPGRTTEQLNKDAGEGAAAGAASGAAASYIASAAGAGSVFGPLGAVIGTFGGMIAAAAAGAAGGAASATAYDVVDGASALNADQVTDLERFLQTHFENVAQETGHSFNGEVTTESAGALLHALANFDVLGSGARGFDAPPKVGDPKILNTPGQLDDYIKGLEDDLQSVGDDSQLVNSDLQAALNKQQQTLQMMTNIAKMLHDTTLAIVRKTGD
jgi:uncharacterized membrane protein